MRHWFKNPVSIWSGNVRRNVTSVEEAARLLLEDWPVCDAEAAESAVAAKRALLAAYNGGPIDEAEAAFREAARAAGVLVAGD